MAADIPPKRHPPAPPPPPPDLLPPQPPDSAAVLPGSSGLSMNAAEVTLPLSAALRAAYQSLLGMYQASIDQTTDAAALQLLNDSYAEVNDILTKDNLYALKQDTTLFGVLQAQIQSTNDSLTALKAKIALVASHIALAAKIIDAINKVITMVAAA